MESSPELLPFLLKNVKKSGISLGMGSYGFVEEVSMNGAPCAGKKMHDMLLQSQNQSKAFLVKKLVDECQLMSELKHPNIVQFFGLSFFEDSHYPMIVMEKLHSNLDAVLTGHRSLPLTLKNILMQDICRGLNYLHTQEPPIIHRDITARNILVTSSMMAKIADLGNARIIQSHGIPSTLSRMPGTLVYMPPEALYTQPKYDTSLDIFSYGHLTLFILLQEFPGNLLPYTYPDLKNPRKLLARSEVERRKVYIDQCVEKLGDRNPIVTYMDRCLSDDPQRRPTAVQILDMLTKVESTEKGVYGEFRRKINFPAEEVISMKVESGTNALESSSNHHGASKQMLGHIKSGEPMVLDKFETVKQGFFKKEKHEYWEQYMFRIEDQKYLKYYSDLKKKPAGEIELSSITQIVKLPHREKHLFEIHFDGTGSPWIIRTKTEDIQICWMEGISSLGPEPVNCAYAEIYMGKEKATTLRNAPTYPAEKNTDEVVYHYPTLPTSLQQQKLKKYYAINVQPTQQPQDDTYSYITHEQIQKHKNETQHQDVAVHSASNNPIPLNEEPISVSTSRKADHNEIMNAVLQSDPFKDLTDEQVEQLAQTLNGVMKNRQGYREELGRKQEDEALKAAETADRKDDRLDEVTYEPILLPDGGAASFSNPIPPPLPPKKVKFKARQLKPEGPSNWQEYDQGSEEKIKHDGPFRGRLKAESRRNASLRRINNFSKQLAQHMDPISENDDHDIHCPEWGTAKSTVPNKSFGNKEDEDTLLRQLTLSKSSIKNLKLIGAGNFGKVFRGDLTLDNGKRVEVAMKTVQFKTEKDEENFKQEISMMSKIMHPNVVHLYGLIPQENLIVLEYMSKGDLKTFLEANPRPVNKLVRFMSDIVMGMHHLSELGLVHRDLAARNILVNENELCKVADLGQMVELPKEGDKSHIVTDGKNMPIRWCAPEYLTEKRCSTASDVWSFGILMWEMANPGKLPYENYSNHHELVTKIKAGYTPTIPRMYPKDVQKIMKSCWYREPEKRPNFFYIFMFLNRVNFITKVQ